MAVIAVAREGNLSWYERTVLAWLAAGTIQ